MDCSARQSLTHAETPPPPPPPSPVHRAPRPAPPPQRLPRPALTAGPTVTPTFSGLGLHPGTSVNFSFPVSNDTDAPVSGLTYQLYWSADPTLDPNDTPAGTFPNNTLPGTYHLLAQVDPGNNVAENDESNNTLLANAVTVSAPALTGALATPAELAANSRARLTLSLTHPSATTRLHQKYAITYYLSADPTFGPDDTPFAKRTITATLAKHQTRSYPLTAKLPATAPLGTH